MATTVKTSIKDMVWIRTCKPDGSSHGDYKWDLTIGAVNVAPDWDPTPRCGGGLHGLPGGEGDWSLLDWGPEAVAVLFSVEGDDWIQIGTEKAKCRAAKVLDIGSLDKLLPRLAASGSCSRLAASGECSHLAASGEYSHLAASGEYSRLAASGEYSRLAASGEYSRLAASGSCSRLAASGKYSRLAASGECSRVKLGPKSCAVLTWWDDNTGRPRFTTLYADEDGILQDVWYGLDATGKPVVCQDT